LVPFTVRLAEVLFDRTDSRVRLIGDDDRAAVVPVVVPVEPVVLPVVDVVAVLPVVELLDVDELVVLVLVVPVPLPEVELAATSALNGSLPTTLV
jgi:hypothetical protein